MLLDEVSAASSRQLVPCLLLDALLPYRPRKLLSVLIKPYLCDSKICIKKHMKKGKKSPLLAAFRSLKAVGAHRGGPASTAQRQAGCISSACSEEQRCAIGQSAFKLLFMVLCLQLHKAPGWSHTVPELHPGWICLRVLRHVCC